MNDLVTPPAERDLPPGRAARMRRELLAATRGPARHTPRWRPMIAAAAALTLIAGLATTLEVRRERGVQVLAMSPGELDPSLREATDQCLRYLDPKRYNPEFPADFIPVSRADVTIAARQGDRYAVLFLNKVGYFGCDLTMTDGQEVSGGMSTEAWPHREWLPGPVQRLSLSSSQSWGGAVTVLGRVSARVKRLVLEHGNGHTTTARLAKGAFGLITRTDDVRRDAELVSYDAAGREIDRRPLFTTGENDRCYTDPEGKVIYGVAGRDCRPADPWTP
jgi:hypothetical protein